MPRISFRNSGKSQLFGYSQIESLYETKMVRQEVRIEAFKMDGTFQVTYQILLLTDDDSGQAHICLAVKERNSTSPNAIPFPENNLFSAWRCVQVLAAQSVVTPDEIVVAINTYTSGTKIDEDQFADTQVLMSSDLNRIQGLTLPENIVTTAVELLTKGIMEPWVFTVESEKGLHLTAEMVNFGVLSQTEAQIIRNARISWTEEYQPLFENFVQFYLAEKDAETQQRAVGEMMTLVAALMERFTKETGERLLALTCYLFAERVEEPLAVDKRLIVTDWMEVNGHVQAQYAASLRIWLYQSANNVSTMPIVRRLIYGPY